MKKNGIRHIRSAPFHPATNGLGERAVQTLKHGMKKTLGGTLETRLQRFLSTYRVMPQTTTGVSPSELLFNRKVRTRLYLVQPCVATRVVQRQMQQKLNHDHGVVREFRVGDAVNVKHFSTGPKWLPGVVVQVTGPLSYTIRLFDGRVIKRHTDDVWSRAYQPEMPEERDGEMSESWQSAAATLPSVLPSLPPQPMAELSPVPAVVELTIPADSFVTIPAKSVVGVLPDPPNLAKAYGTSPLCDVTSSPMPTSEDRPVRQRRLPERLKNYVMNWF